MHFNKHFWISLGIFFLLLTIFFIASPLKDDPPKDSEEYFTTAVIIFSLLAVYTSSYFFMIRRYKKKTIFVLGIVAISLMTIALSIVIGELSALAIVLLFDSSSSGPMPLAVILFIAPVVFFWYGLGLGIYLDVLYIIMSIKRKDREKLESA